MNRQHTVSLVVAASLAVTFAFSPAAMAQAGAPGTKQMQDAQRKAHEKARNTQQHPHQNTEHKKAASAPSASAP
jgi:hypothetical protein